MEDVELELQLASISLLFILLHEELDSDDRVKHVVDLLRLQLLQLVLISLNQVLADESGEVSALPQGQILVEELVHHGNHH